MDGWSVFQCNILNKEEKGKIIFCESREDDSTRLFIHRLSYMMNALTKNGWWDTFTISSQKCKKGLYLCVIDSFRVDRNGYLNAIVTPKKYLGEQIDEESAAWDFFFETGLFCRHYHGFRRYHERFNVTHLLSLYEEEVDAIIDEKKKMGDDCISAYMESCNYIFNKFIADEVTLEEIANALDEKTELQKLSEDLTINVARDSEKYSNYPLICKKLPVKDGYYSVFTTEEWLQRKTWEYEDLKLGDSKDILDRVEAVLQYWVDFHEKEKAARKAARKAAKKK